MSSTDRLNFRTLTTPRPIAVDVGISSGVTRPTMNWTMEYIEKVSWTEYDVAHVHIGG